MFVLLDLKTAEQQTVNLPRVTRRSKTEGRNGEEGKEG